MLARLRLALSSNWSTLFIRFEVFVFSLLGKLLLLFLPLLFAGHAAMARLAAASVYADGPDKAQQFAAHCGRDLALLLARRGQPGPCGLGGPLPLGTIDARGLPHPAIQKKNARRGHRHE